MHVHFIKKKGKTADTNIFIKIRYYHHYLKWTILSNCTANQTPHQTIRMILFLLESKTIISKFKRTWPTCKHKI